ncbi:hypothetical protein [Pseudomonas sp. FP1742]|uniref:hypothetical protein n=1 Tax=Pseudomonas sp. FP1742 TaxID=2954079 RepID=UPI0027375FFD|nr:hypothetical protein [Pseudomonas sp. FP1742]WLG49147.1 hypothetical protein PSH64_20730 [Pseudomonas sp. FP1742]
MNPTWIAFAERWPAQNAALDDQSVKTTPRVLVTNNLDARDRMGRMSHVWYAAPMKSSAPDVTGPVIAFDEGERKIHGLTHWFEMDDLQSIAAEGAKS